MASGYCESLLLTATQAGQVSKGTGRDTPFCPLLPQPGRGCCGLLTAGAAQSPGMEWFGQQGRLRQGAVPVGGPGAAQLLF